VDSGDLSEPARRSLKVVVQRNAEAISHAVSGLALDDAVHAICIWPSEDPADLVAYEVDVGLERDRQRALEELSPYEAFVCIWNGSDYAFHDVWSERDLRDSPGFDEAESRVVSELSRAGVLDPSRWVMNRVARRLSEGRPVRPVTDDFVAFVLNSGFSDELLENLRESSPPDVRRELRAKGLLPTDVTELAGFPAK
jgi:hypothetical protein